MAKKLVQNRSSYLLMRGRTYYFRFVLPLPIRRLFPTLPAEVKRSLRTDSYSDALALVSKKIPLIRLIQRCDDGQVIKDLLVHLCDFTQEVRLWVSDRLNALQAQTVEKPTAPSPKASSKVPPAKTPKLSKVWQDYVKWKSWPTKRAEDNQRLFDSLLFFIGDRPVERITKQCIRAALHSIAELPQRNKRRYRGKALKELAKIQVPPEDRVSDKYVREHLKICQSLFSRYLVQEVDVLERSPTEGLRLETNDSRFASLTDEQVKTALERTLTKPQWFRLVCLLAAYSGARRTEIASLRSEDIRFCEETGRYYLAIHRGKTKAARRSIPVHKVLIDTGLLEWAESANGLLFPTAASTPNRVTDLFNSLMDDKFSEAGERIVFHSLRHTFITKARSKGIETVLVQQVVGHEKKGAGITDRYTHSFELRELLPVVDVISY